MVFLNSTQDTDYFEERKKTKPSGSHGFTLIELLVVIGIISILSSAIIVAVNPARQFKLARDSKRMTDVNSILNAIGQNMSENKGVFSCNDAPQDIPSTVKTIKSGSEGFDLYPCIVPDFLSTMPYDPNKAKAHFVTGSDYDTEYTIKADPNGRVTITAESEIDPLKPITATR